MSSSKQNEWADRALGNMDAVPEGTVTYPLGVSLVDANGVVEGTGARTQSPSLERLLEQIIEQNDEVLMHLRNITGINED